MIVWGPGFTSHTHRHHCIQLVMTLDGSLRLRGTPDERWRRCGAALIREDAPHEVDAQADAVLLAFIDAHSELGASLGEHLTADITRIDRRTVARWRAALGSPVTGASVELWVRACLLRGRRSADVHPRVERVLAYVRQQVATTSDLSLKTLASVAGLSPSRFLHLFTAGVGVPPRAYVRWLRLQRAACALRDGARVAAAAHDAGFSDAAHLTRTFREMMGVTPSDIALARRHSRGVGADGAQLEPPHQGLIDERAPSARPESHTAAREIARAGLKPDAAR